MDIGLPELLIILLIVLLLFGPGRIAKVMGDLGQGIGAFKNSLSGEVKEPSALEAKPTEEK